MDDNAARRIVSALDAGPDDEVLEVGPGRGALTRHLAGAVGRLVLVELDDALAEELARAYRERDDVTVVHGDVLEVDLAAHVRDPARLRVVGNLPYNVATPILFRLLERPRPERIVVMLQREVARRLVASPGSRTYGALSVGAQVAAACEILFGVGRRSFRPVPRVDSSIVALRPYAPPRLTPEQEDAVRGLVRALFQWRRKQLGTTLREHPELSVPTDRLEAVAIEAGVSLTDRPERLAPDDLVRLAAALP